MKAEEYSVALEDSPEIAALIGVIISCLAAIEHTLPFLLKKITGMHLDYATATLGLLRMETRLLLLSSLANVDETPPANKAAIQNLVDRLKAANTLRNKYAHATYGAGPGAMIMVPYYSDTKQKVKQLMQITADTVRADLVEIKEAICQLEAFVHQDKMPTKFTPLAQRKKTSHAPKASQRKK